MKRAEICPGPPAGVGIWKTGWEFREVTRKSGAKGIASGGHRSRAEQARLLAVPGGVCGGLFGAPSSPPPTACPTCALAAVKVPAPPPAPAQVQPCRFPPKNTLPLKLVYLQSMIIRTHAIHALQVLVKAPAKALTKAPARVIAAALAKAPSALLALATVLTLASCDIAGPPAKSSTAPRWNRTFPTARLRPTPRAWRSSTSRAGRPKPSS